MKPEKTSLDLSKHGCMRVEVPGLLEPTDHSNPRLLVKLFIHTGKNMLEALTFPVASYRVLLCCGRPRFLHSCFLILLVELGVASLHTVTKVPWQERIQKERCVVSHSSAAHGYTLWEGTVSRCGSACDSKNCEAICHVSVPR